MESPATQTKATILVVDDNPANLGVLTGLLAAHGFRILMAQRGETGFQIAQRAQPDLILLDVQLPGMDGFTACQRLKADISTADIPVLFMTVRMESEDKIKGFAVGGVDYITKPFQAEEVLARVTTHLRLRQLTHSLQEQNVQLQAAESALRQANEDLERRVRERTAELVAERNLQRTLIDNLPDNIYVKDTQSRFMLANTATMRHLNVSTLDQLLGKTDFDYFPPELAAKYYADEQAVMQSGLSMLNQEELGIDTETGAEIWGLTSKVPVRDVQGRVVGLVGIGRDITARKWAEQQLRANEEQLRIGAQRLQILHTIDLAILAAQSPEAIAQAALGHIRALVPCRWASVAVCDSNAQVVAALAINADNQIEPVLHADGPLDLRQIGYSLQWGDVQVVDDTSLLASPPAVLAPVPSADIHSYVNVPLIAAGELLGILTTAADRPRVFAPDHITMLREVANQVAVGLRQARLYTAEQHARRLAEILRAANLALTQTLDLDTILDTLLEYLEQLAPYDSASAMVYEADARIVVRSVRGQAGWGDVHLARDMILDVASFPHLHSLLANQTSILVADSAVAPFWNDDSGSPQAGSWLGVPLIAGGLVIGLYTLYKRQPGFFTDEHRQIAESLAAQAAVAIQNAQLFAEMSAARARLQAVSRQLVAVQEAERAQIARDLHDQIGQMLTGLKLVLAIGARSTPEMVQVRLAEAQALVNDLTTSVRELSLDLRPAMLDDLGLLPTLLWYIKRYTAQTEIQVTMKHTSLEQRLASDVEIVVYRLVQEGLTNVARHAGVRDVAIWIWRREESIGLQIEDQGRGFSPEQVLNAHTSSGLVGMVERVRLLGGQLTIESAPGQGTRLTAELPLGDALE